MGFTYATAADLQAYASDWLARREEEQQQEEEEEEEEEEQQQELRVELGKEKQEQEW